MTFYTNSSQIFSFIYLFYLTALFTFQKFLGLFQMHSKNSYDKSYINMFSTLILTFYFLRKL